VVNKTVAAVLARPADILEHMPLQGLNTLALAATARYYYRLSDSANLPKLLAFAERRELPVLVLGGGSNMVLGEDYPGLVIQMAVLGIQVRTPELGTQSDAPETIIVSAGSGENWHQLVMHCLGCGYYGLENLALIPGTVGAAPVQNIGAYGVELAEVFHSLRGWDCQQRCWRTLWPADCDFGYRDSIFKAALKQRFIITEVRFILRTCATVNSDYRGLNQQLAAQGIKQPSPQQLAQAVITLRQSKLPDPAELPNAGSFFKNPLVAQTQLKTLLEQYPELVYYPAAGGRVKLAAGWLIEQAGWKGRALGPVAMHHLQALVLVNKGGANGAQVLALAAAVQRQVLQCFAVQLEIEPELIVAPTITTER
jgi:UDP-N-acetylmuramate dehydrogenase